MSNYHFNNIEHSSPSISLVRLIYKVNTLYKDDPQALCCSNCNPEAFPMEDIKLEKKPGLKRGRRTAVTEEFRAYAKERLVAWRDRLLEREHPGSHLATAESLLDDDIIDKLASQGKRVSSETDLLTRVRWADGMVSLVDPFTTPNDRCRELFIELQDIYKKYDEDHIAREDTEDELNKDKDEGGGDAKDMGGSQVTRTNAGTQVRHGNLVLNLNL